MSYTTADASDADILFTQSKTWFSIYLQFRINLCMFIIIIINRQYKEARVCMFIIIIIINRQYKEARVCMFIIIITINRQYKEARVCMFIIITINRQYKEARVCMFIIIIIIINRQYKEARVWMLLSDFHVNLQLHTCGSESNTNYLCIRQNVKINAEYNLMTDQSLQHFLK